jgi:phage gpG-like protein
VARFSIVRTAGNDLGSVRISFEPLAVALQRLADAGATASSEVMPAIAEDLVSAVHEVFLKEGAVGNKERWPGFWWEREGLPRPKGRRWQGVLHLLQDTAVLVNSITPVHEALVAEAFTNVPYAGFHVSQRPRSVIPLRDFTDVDFDRVQEDAAELILSQLLASAAE